MPEYRSVGELRSVTRDSGLGGPRFYPVPPRGSTLVDDDRTEGVRSSRGGYCRAKQVRGQPPGDPRPGPPAGSVERCGPVQRSLPHGRQVPRSRPFGERGRHRDEGQTARRRQPPGPLRSRYSRAQRQRHHGLRGRADLLSRLHRRQRSNHRTEANDCRGCGAGLRGPELRAPRRRNGGHAGRLRGWRFRPRRVHRWGGGARQNH